MDTNVILTGINASGKTTYLKTTLLNVILTQQWGCGFYKSCAIQPFHQIHSYLNIPDTSARDSLFQAESRRCKEILDSIVLGGRHFCIFDELYSGTNPDEASKSAYGFLRYLAKRENVRFMLTTHYIGVCKRLEEEECDGIQYLQMDVEEEGDEYVYKHCLKDGICEIQGGVQVLRKMEYPEELLGYIM
jgi:DNA mismatch repair ATPase MutS